MNRRNLRRGTWKKRIGRGTITLGLAVTVGLLPRLAPAIPQEFSYQAYLTSPAGAPVLSNNVDVRVSIYDGPGGPAVLLDQQQFLTNDLSIATGTGGFINVVYPSGLTASELNNDLWFEIEIRDNNGAGVYELLGPRHRVVASPIALNSDLLDGLDSTAFSPTVHGHVEADVTDLSKFETVNVPAGTDPAAANANDTLNLTSSDNSVTISGTGANTVDFVINASTLTGFVTIAGAQTITGAKTFSAATDFTSAGNTMGDSANGTQLTVEGVVTGAAANATTDRELIVVGDARVDGDLKMGAGSLHAGSDGTNSYLTTTGTEDLNVNVAGGELNITGKGTQTGAPTAAIDLVNLGYLQTNYSTDTDNDTTYLRLDASNDPLTGNLDVTGNVAATGTVTGSNLSGTNTGDQNLYATVNSDAGTTTANALTDTLTVTGGANIDTSIVGDVLTIDAPGVLTGGTADTTYLRLDATNDPLTGNLDVSANIGATGTITAGGNMAAANLSGTNTGDQNLYATVTGDTGSTTANVLADTLTVTGGTNIDTTVVGDTITVDAVGLLTPGAADGSYLRLDGTNDPVTGAVSFTAAGNAAGDGNNASQLTINGVATGAAANATTDRELIVVGDARIDGDLKMGAGSLHAGSDGTSSYLTTTGTEDLNVTVAGGEFNITGKGTQTGAPTAAIDLVNLGYLQSNYSTDADNDTTYLRLDASNDPLTGNLDVSANVAATGTVTGSNLSGTNTGDQNLFATVNGDTGNTTANALTDAITIAGGANIDTTVVGDTITIDATGLLSPASADLTYLRLDAANDPITGDLAVNADIDQQATGVDTSATGETGAALGVRALSDPQANRAVGVRGRTIAPGAEPANGLGRLIQGVVGSGQSDGGPSTQIDGGFFQGRVNSGATTGVAAVTGVGSEVDAEAGAAGFGPTNLFLGGRFVSTGTNIGAAQGAGSVSLAQGVHAGPNVGSVSIGRDSASVNTGVTGAANATDVEVGSLPITYPTVINADGVGVIAYNNTAAGTALFAANSGGGNAIETDGDVVADGDVTAVGNMSAANLSGTNTGDQNLFATVAGESGSTTANTLTDSLTITGGANIDTTVVGDVLTIDATGLLSPGTADTTYLRLDAANDPITGSLDVSNSITATGAVTGSNLSGTNTGDQNLFATVTGDSGNTTANALTDNLTIAGGANIDTTVSGDTITIDATGLLTPGAADGSYLRLDGTNDPVTGAVSITAAGNDIGSSANATQLIINGVATGAAANATTDRELIVVGDARIDGDLKMGGGSLHAGSNGTDSYLTTTGTEDLNINAAGGQVNVTGVVTQTAPPSAAADLVNLGYLQGNYTTTTTSDSTYLRLDGSNDPITNDLSVSANIAATGTVTGSNLSGTNTGDQNMWATLEADTGNTTANTLTDTFGITGGTNIDTTIVGDTLTIDAVGLLSPGQADASYLRLDGGNDPVTGDVVFNQSLEVDGHVAIGPTAGISGNRIVYVEEITANTSDLSGVTTLVQAEPATDSTANYYGNVSTASWTSGTSDMTGGELVGTFSQAQNSSPNDVQTAIANSALVRAGGGTTTNATGVASTVSAAGGAITNAVALSGNVTSGGGNIGDGYGLKIDTVAATGTAFGVYVGEAAARNYFAGPVFTDSTVEVNGAGSSIGDGTNLTQLSIYGVPTGATANNTSDRELIVEGDVRIDGDLKMGSGSLHAGASGGFAYLTTTGTEDLNITAAGGEVNVNGKLTQTATPSSTNDVETFGHVSSNYVNLSSGQTIGGAKIWSSTATFQNSVTMDMNGNVFGSGTENVQVRVNGTATGSTANSTNERDFIVNGDVRVDGDFGMGTGASFKLGSPAAGAAYMTTTTGKNIDITPSGGSVNVTGKLTQTGTPSAASDVATVSYVSSATSALTNANITNRTRTMFLAPGEFVRGATHNTSAGNFSAVFEERGHTYFMDNAGTSTLSVVFVVPRDFVAGAPPNMTIYWNSDEATANNAKVNMNVNFTHLTNLGVPGSAITYRYNIRQSSAGTDNMESPDPNQSAITASSIPEAGDSYANSPANWNPGDVIILNISRFGSSVDDPNGGNVYFYGIKIDYTADM